MSLTQLNYNFFWYACVLICTLIHTRIYRSTYLWKCVDGYVCVSAYMCVCVNIYIYIHLFFVFVFLNMRFQTLSNLISQLSLHTTWHVT